MENKMKTFDGVDIEVGIQVVLLQVPVIGQHEFKVGKVVKLTDKMVHVEYNKDDRWWSNVGDTVVKRYPEQLISVKFGGDEK